MSIWLRWAIIGPLGLLAWLLQADFSFIPQFQETATPQAVTRVAVLQSPSGGEALQGVVPVVGSVQGEAAFFSEIAFAYAEDPTNTWFWIAEHSTPVENSPITQWDTTTLTDGIYRLRLRVIWSDGSRQEQVIEGLRVRNYTLVETSTPIPTSVITPTMPPQPTITFSPTPPPDFIPSPVVPAAQPTNPAQVTPQAVGAGLARGALITLAAFALAMLYSGVKAWLRR